MDEMVKDGISTAEGAELPAPAVTTVPADESDDDGGLYIKFRKPYEFERKTYDGIDLSGLEDLTGNDMIAVNKIMSRTSSSVEIMPEVSMEYACHLAARASKQPVEFFLGMSPKELMKVKNRVMGFLFGAD